MSTFEHQDLLDDLYWNSARTLKSIAEEFGLTAAEVTRLVTPRSAGIDCWWCRAPVCYRRRSDRDNARHAYGSFRCTCGATQPPTQPEGLTPSLATILVPAPSTPGTYGGQLRRARSTMSDTSHVLVEGVRALNRCRLRWSGGYATIDVTLGPDEMARVLSELPERFVVVPSLCHLATNEGDALALFFRLVHEGWRVMTSANLDRFRDWYATDWYDEMVPSWEQIAMGPRPFEPASRR